MVLWTSNNTELAETSTASHCLMNVHGVVCSQIIPQKNEMVVHHGHTKLLNLQAYVVTKIVENVDCCANAVHAPNPTLRMLYTSTDMWREPWIPRLNCKEDCNFGTMVIVPIFLHTKKL